MDLFANRVLPSNFLQPVIFNDPQVSNPINKIQNATTVSNRCVLPEKQSTALTEVQNLMHNVTRESYRVATIFSEKNNTPNTLNLANPASALPSNVYSDSLVLPPVPAENNVYRVISSQNIYVIPKPTGTPQSNSLAGSVVMPRLDLEKNYRAILPKRSEQSGVPETVPASNFPAGIHVPTAFKEKNPVAATVLTSPPAVLVTDAQKIKTAIRKRQDPRGVAEACSEIIPPGNVTFFGRGMHALGYNYFCKNSERTRSVK